jgi:molecular chaperone DnaK (HSP70)
MPLKIVEGPWLVASKNRELGSVSILDIPPGKVGQECIKVTLRVEDDGVLIAKANILDGSDPEKTLRVEKTEHLLTGMQVHVLQSQMDAETKKEWQQVTDARRGVLMKHLIENVKLFMENESKTSRMFTTLVKPEAQVRLNASLARWLPDKLRRVPTEAEYRHAKHEAIELLAPYFRGLMPS